MTLPTRRLGAAAERAVELIATVEALPPDAGGQEVAEALGAVLRQWDDLIDERFVEQIDEFAAAVGEIARIFDVDDANDAAVIINEWLATSASTPRLVDEPGWGWHFHLERDGADWPTWLLASTAHSFAVALVDHGHPVWGRCRATDCGRPYLDRGRRQPQRFCSTTCATRERVRRHRTHAV
jgi:hypothetical protein